MRADEEEDALENICWENGDELARPDAWGKPRLPADTDRAAQCLGRAGRFRLLLVLPSEGEPHCGGDVELDAAKPS